MKRLNNTNSPLIIYRQTPDMSRFQTCMKYAHQYDIKILSYIEFNEKINSRMRSIRGIGREISLCPHRSVHISVQLECKTLAMVEVRSKRNS